MRCSATKRPIPARQAPGGFTLIELLVVMFIIGIVASVGVLSLSQLGSRSLEQTARQLVARIELARDQTLLTGQSLSIGIGRHALVILERQWLDERQVTWVPIEDGPLRPHDFEQHGLEPRLYRDDRRARLRDEPEHNRIGIDSGGNLEPFELVLRQADGQTGIVLRADGPHRVRAFEYPLPASGEPRPLFATAHGVAD